MNNVFVLGEYWYFLSGEGKTYEDAKQRITSIEEEWKKECPKAHVFAICQIVRDSFQGTDLAKRWQICVITADESNAVVKSSISNQVSDSRVVKVNYGKIYQTVEEILTTETTIITNKAHLTHPEVILRKINKLIVYLLKTVNRGDQAWPYADQKTSLASIKDTFSQFNKLFAPNLYLTTDNQNKFSSYLSTLNRDFQEASMTIKEISRKIISKIKRTQSGEGFFKRVQSLIDLGIRSIDWNNPNLSVDELIDLLHSLKEQAQLFHSHANVESSQKEFQQVVDEIIKRIRFFENKQNKIVLARFCLILFTEIKSYRRNNLVSPAFGAVIWTLNAFMRNTPEAGDFQEPFILSMRRQKCLGLITKGIADDVVNFFFPLVTEGQSPVWRPIADFIIGLGQFDLFKKLTDRAITENYCISRFQLDYLYELLNNYLWQEGSLLKNYQNMYHYFLNRLASFNRLHLLKPYARDPEHQKLLRSNLIDPNKLDVTCMRTVDDLSVFFSNATFKILEASRKGAIPRRIEMQHTLVRLFRGYGSNPVGNEDQFIEEMGKFINDFRPGYDSLFVEILGRLGDLSDSNNFTLKVEEWVTGSVMPLYRSLVQYVITSLPLEWQEIDLASCGDLAMVLFDDKLHYIDGRDGQAKLVEWITGNLVSDQPKEVFVTDDLFTVQDKLSKALTPAALQKVLALTESFYRYSGDGTYDEELKRLSKLILKKMKKETQSLGTFEERLSIWIEFFRAISPFFKHLEPLVEERFFKEGVAKTAAVDKVTAAYKEFMEKEKRERDADFDPNDLINKTSQSLKYLARMVASLCQNEIYHVLNAFDLAQLGEMSGQFESIIRRMFDNLSFTKEEYVESFTQHTINQKSYTILGHQRTLKDDLGQLEIKDEVMKLHRDTLLKRVPPIHFITSNQALAMQLVTADTFRFINGSTGPETNLMLKLGTGQGKSLVIAKAALEESNRLSGPNKGIVLVITSYAHLAKRDQELGQSFFDKFNLRSTCILKTSDIERQFAGNVPQILYADIKTLQRVVRDVSLSLFKGEHKPGYREFLRAIYGIDNRKIRLILDEFDLLLEDYKYMTPHVQHIDPELLKKPLDPKYRNYRTVEKDIVDLERESSVRGQASEGAVDGQVSLKASPCVSGQFVFPIAFHLISGLIDDVERIIGFSGTCDASIETGLPRSLYFEIPSSFNPQKFGTDFDTEISTGVSKDQKITYRNKKVIGSAPKKNHPQDQSYVINQEILDEYFREILADVKAVQKEETDRAKVRPILIFVDMFLKFKHDTNNVEKDLWNELKVYLSNNGIRINPLTDKFVHEKTNEVTDAELQSIASAGSVTIAPIKYARGSDIRLSLDIKKGLHVLIGRNVPHFRILSQMIGRTGRMGQQGSYSTITMGDVIQPDLANFPLTEKARMQTVTFLKALHQLTKLFMTRILKGDKIDQELCQKWLVFTAAAIWSDKQKINRVVAKELCGIGDDLINKMGGDQIFV